MGTPTQWTPEGRRRSTPTTLPTTSPARSNTLAVRPTPNLPILSATNGIWLAEANLFGPETNTFDNLTLINADDRSLQFGLAARSAK